MTPDDLVALVDRGRLIDYLDSVVGIEGEPELSVLSGGRSNLTYLIRSGGSEYVLRRRPIGKVPAGAHDMAREYRVQSALQGSAVPLARVYGYCTDEGIVGAPFYVMSRVNGSVYHRRADAAGLSPAEATAISEATVAVLADLHRIEYREVGLGDLGRPEGFVARRITRWLEQWRNSDHRPYPLVDELAGELQGQVPAKTDSTLVHGDYRLGNMIVDPALTRPVAAVLDWEMSTLGDPLTDLAHLLVYWESTRGRLTHESQTIADQPGFLSGHDLADRYAMESGRDISALPFYLAFEHWRAAIIKEAIFARTRAGEQVDDDAEELGATVERHLEEAADILGRA